MSSETSTTGSRTSLVKAEAIERSLLSCLFQDEAAFNRVLDVVTEASFFDPAHQIIYHAIAQQAMASKPVDVMSVFSLLETRGQESNVGGLDYLNRLLSEPADVFSARNYAEQVAERFMRRRLAELGKAITNSAIEPNGLTGVELLENADKMMTEVASGHYKVNKLNTSSELMVQLLDNVQAAADSDQELLGLPTGFIDLDRMTSGLQGGDLIILAARPSMGKTALAINIAENVAIELGLPVLIFTLEMTPLQLMQRSVASVGRIHLQRLKNGRLLDDEWSRLSEAVEKYREDCMLVDDQSMTVLEMSASARRVKKERGKLGLVVVDYLQLMNSSSTKAYNEETRAASIGEITRSLKQLAKELDAPIILLSQLNRAVETRADKRPMMSDLRESGSIEQDADIIMFIYRDEYYTKEACKEPGVAEVIISKHRNGSIGTVKLNFEKERTKFSSLSAVF